MVTCVNIDNEATRGVVASILWRHAQDIVNGERLAEDIGDLADRALGLTLCASEREDVDQVLDDVAQVRQLIDGLEVGTSVDLPVTPERAREILEHGIIQAIQGYADPGYVDGGFFAQATDIREKLLASNDAAVGLLRSLSAVEVVA